MPALLPSQMRCLLRSLTCLLEGAVLCLEVCDELIAPSRIFGFWGAVDVFLQVLILFICLTVCGMDRLV